ncbi:hypothetical protein B0H13DRAFT_2356329 [Mycena leptocephala]|nr:hypothetical protein B0H13DRAFT_2356329 [Mycena leptocephala]
MAREWCLSKEMRLLVVKYACSSRRPYVIGDFLSIRSSIRASSKEFASIVDLHPPFWNRIVCSPRTPEQHVFDVTRRAGSRPVEVVLRFADSDAEGLGTGSSWETRLDRFMSRALPLLGPVLSSCAELCVEAANAQVLEAMLLHVKDAPMPSCVMTFRFGDNTEAEFSRPTVLTFRATHVSTFVVSHMSSLVSSSAVCMPIGTEVAWTQFGCRLASAHALSCLVLDAINFGDLPVAFVASVPMPQVLTLDLRFGGLTRMALGVRRLNFPRLMALIFRCESAKDLACMLLCSAVLVQVDGFQLVTHRMCRVSHKFRHLYEYLHRVKHLDLRRASYVAFNAFVFATTPIYAGHGSYCRACNLLVQLTLCNVSLTAVKELVEVRREVSYRELEELTVETSVSMVEPSANNWLLAQTFQFSLRIV